MNLRLNVATIILLISPVFAAAATLPEEFQQGRDFFDRAEYTMALSAFEKLNADLKADSEFNFYYALSLLKTRQTKQAITVMKRAIDLDPDAAEYRYALNLIYASRMSELSLLRAALLIAPAKATLLKAIELDPGHVGATRALTDFLLDVPGALGGDKDLAQELMNRLWTLDSSVAAMQEAKLEKRMGNLARAEQLYLQAASTPGSEAITRLRLAEFYVDQQQYEKAISFGEEYLTLPKHWWDFARDTDYAHLWLALAYHASGDQVNFRKHSQAVDMENMPARTREEIGKIYQNAGIDN